MNDEELDDRLRRFFERHPPGFRPGTSLAYNGYDSTPAPHGTGGKRGVHLWTARGEDESEVTEILCLVLNREARRLGRL